jgi:hypothetical protein
VKIKFKEVEQPKVERTYPYFGRYKWNTFTVLFFGKETGVVVYGDVWKKGHFSNVWGECEFDPIKGEVTFKS